MLPNFFILGVPKAGTSSLYEYLAQHPEIYMSPVKEPRFFSYDRNNPEQKKSSLLRIKDLSGYEALFDGVNNEMAIGEASPGYLTSDFAAEKIYALLPQAKLIAILRNPIDRAYSAYQMEVRAGKEARSVEEVLISDSIIVQRGKYYQGIKNYIDRFGKASLHIILFEDLLNEPSSVIKGIFQHLGVDDTFSPDMTNRHNEGGLIRRSGFANIYKFFKQYPRLKKKLKQVLPKWLRNRWTEKKLSSKERAKPLPEAVRRSLCEYYREDIESINREFGLDLSHWLKSKND